MGTCQNAPVLVRHCCLTTLISQLSAKRFPTSSLTTRASFWLDAEGLAERPELLVKRMYTR